jgi:hypothetical protein
MDRAIFIPDSKDNHRSHTLTSTGFRRRAGKVTLDIWGGVLKVSVVVLSQGVRKMSLLYGNLVWLLHHPQVAYSRLVTQMYADICRGEGYEFPLIMEIWFKYFFVEYYGIIGLRTASRTLLYGISSVVSHSWA